MKLSFYRTPFALEINGTRTATSWTVGEDGVVGIECLGGGVTYIEFDDALRRPPLVITPSGYGISGEARSEPMVLPRKIGKK